MGFSARIRGILGATIVAGVAILTYAGANAQTAEQLDACMGKGRPPADQRISACDAIIKSGNFTGSALSRVFVLRGVAYSMKKDSTHAIADFDQALRLDPANEVAMSERALEYMLEDKYDPALQDVAQAIKLEPRDPRPWAYQGDINYHSGNDNQALASWAQAIKLAPKWVWAYIDRGEFYLDHGDYQQAIDDFDQVVRIAPPLAMGWENRCRAYAITGQLERALDDCNKALAINARFVNHMVKSGDISAIQMRALVYLKIGRAQAAVTDYDKAAALLPKNAEVLYGRGLAKEKAGDRAGGEADLKVALTIDPQIAKRYSSFGVQ